jgi:hypothetical protein
MKKSHDKGSDSLFFSFHSQARYLLTCLLPRQIAFSSAVDLRVTGFPRECVVSRYQRLFPCKTALVSFAKLK